MAPKTLESQVDPVELPRVNALGRKETRRGTIPWTSTFCAGKNVGLGSELSRNIPRSYKKDSAMAARLRVK